jgi:SAM-dependent methyltransferase
MKKCLACGEAYPSQHNTCLSCGQEPQRLNGILSYAPALANGDSGFKEEHFAELAGLESDHFWFRVRNRLIEWALRSYVPKLSSFLEIGCGTGYVLSGLTPAFPEARLSGSELFSAGLAFAAERLPEADFMQMDARALPFVDEFDSIGAFDVLEHIEEDELVLRQIQQALRLEGVLILTVPQHRWLWSPVDEMACHVRRYSAAELREKLANAGFEIVRSTSFVSILLPAMMASRLVQIAPNEPDDLRAELVISAPLNFLFEKVLRIEAALIRCGLNFPLGGSRLVVARKCL